jgi:PAS domain S-box-containing protein
VEKESLSVENLLEPLLIFVEDSEDLIFAVDKDMNIIYSNRKFRETVGNYKKIDFITPEDHTIFTEKLKEVGINKSKSDKFRISFISDKGEKIPAEGFIIPKIENGEVEICLAIFKDLSEKTELEMSCRQSEDMFKTLAEESLQGIFLIQDEKYRYVNRVVEIATGYTKEELYEMKPFSIVAEEDRQKVREIYRKVLSGEKVPVTEVRYLTKDGRERWVLMAVSRIEFNGKPAILGNWFDITKIKLLEEELRKSEKKYRDLVENSLIGVYMATVDGDMLLANSALSKILECSLEELYSTKTMEFYKNKSERKRFLKLLFEKGSIYGFETKLITKKGREIDVIVSAKLENEMITGTIMDITERKNLEERLKEEKEFIEKIIDTANSLIVELDVQGNVLMLNRKCEELMDLKREEMVGKDWFDFIPDEHREEARRMFEEVKKGNPVSCAIPVKTKDGERTVFWSNTVVRRGKQKIIVCIGVDITEEIKAKRRAEELVDTLSLMNKILRHDISNDLSAIIGSIDVFRATGNENMIEIAHKAAERSVELIKAMRELEYAVKERQLYSINVREILNRITEGFNVEINVVGDCTVMGDDAINSVFSNIIRNAIIHGGADRIKISIEKTNGYCEIKIADNGKGVPDDIKKNIFEEGFKYGSTGRTGLGLFIVKKVVERYGGEVHVEDNLPSGAVFVIRIPSANSDLIKCKHEERPQYTKTSLKETHIP